MAGGLMMEAARRRGVAILPVDSEHNAIHQCLRGHDPADVRRLILTASGGPFRARPQETLDAVTPEQALEHPTWNMGPKITIDSATLMNKGLEVIEARWLFDAPPDRIDVVVHPQSIVHSLVELRDGSLIAQLGVTDMRLPIQYAFSYPDRWEAPLPALDLASCGRLEFDRPGRETLSLSRAGLPRPARAGRIADRPQRGERAGRGGVSGAAAAVQRDPCRDRAGARPRGTAGRGRRRDAGGRAGDRRVGAPDDRRGHTQGRISVAGCCGDQSSRIRLRHRRARIRPRAGPLHGRAARRRPRPRVLHRLRSEAAQGAPRRHRVLRQRDTARRLRQNGGRACRRPPRRRTRRVPVQEQVGALPDPDRGAGDERHPGDRRDDVRAVPGRRRAGVRVAASGGRRGSGGLGRRPRRHPTG